MQLRRGEVIGPIVPTLRVGMSLVALQRPVRWKTQERRGGVSTRSVGTMGSSTTLRWVSSTLFV